MQLDQRTRMRISVSSIALGLALSHGAMADITTSLSGYGTIGGTFTSDDDYQYRHDVSEFSGAGHTLDIGLESRIGVQAVFNFGNGFSVTAQEVARQRGDDDFSLGTEWLYAQYQPNSDWKLRLGRVVLSTFLLSDSREVGYAAPWFRAPNELYAGEPFNYLDGGQVIWNHNMGNATVTLQTSYGNTKQTFETNGITLVSDANYVLNVSAKVEYGSFLVRVAQTKISVPTAIPLSATYTVNYDALDKFTSVGFQYDDAKAIVLAEWAKRVQNDVPGFDVGLSKSTQWYVAGGWHFGKLTPLLIYGIYKPDASLLQAEAASYGTFSGSLRYDIVSNVALKAQVSRPQAGNGNYWVTPDPASNSRVNIYSFGVDFVF